MGSRTGKKGRKKAGYICQDVKPSVKISKPKLSLICFYNVLTPYNKSPFSGHFAYIDDPYKAQLESTLLPWKPLYQSLGLCLRFKYLLPAKSKSTLKVFLRESNRENPLLVWRLVGYHGEEWSDAQVALADVKGFQVRAN